jgi:uncharacterized protein
LLEKLAPRRAVECGRIPAKGKRPPASLFSRMEHIIEPALAFSLKASGLWGPLQRRALDVQVTQLRHESAKLPAAFHGYRLLQIADPHIDPPGSEGMELLVHRIASQLRRTAADAVVFTGDYRYLTHGSCARVYPRIGRLMDAVREKNGDIPFYGILGNHDEARMALEFERMGIRMLINENTIVEESGSALVLAGLEESWHLGADDLQAALHGTGPDAYRILLAHAPDSWAEAARSGVDLYLCGHTHGGQVRLPWAGPVIINSTAPAAFTQGLWQSGTMTGYTSNGAGSSLLPIRMNCPPEVVVHELTCAPAVAKSSR